MESVVSVVKCGKKSGNIIRTLQKINSIVNHQKICVYFCGWDEFTEYYYYYITIISICFIIELTTVFTKSKRKNETL